MLTVLAAQHPAARRYQPAGGENAVTATGFSADLLDGTDDDDQARVK